MQAVWIIIVSVIIIIIYTKIKSKVSKTFEYKDTDINTDLKEFRESHAVSNVIKSGALNLKESMVQKYERMCIIDPVSNKNDPSIQKVIADYQDVIMGRVLDPEGLNIPSEELLGVHNPDYDRYLANQAKAQKKASFTYSSEALHKERARVIVQNKETRATNQFFAYLVEQGIPPMMVSSALTETKINTYTADDWKTFCKVVKGYLSTTPRDIVTEFVSLFDEKEVIFDIKKFENFTVFYEYQVPSPILVELIRGRITNEQANRIIDLVQQCKYSWGEAMEEILKEDINKTEEINLRKQYGWKG
jgi:hypothetical protein